MREISQAIADIFQCESYPSRAPPPFVHISEQKAPIESRISGIVIALTQGMNTSTNVRSHHVNEPLSFIRWVFMRGTRVLTCETMISGPRAFDVCVLPSWYRSEPHIERYDRFSRAVQRQAEMARCFRKSGWTLVSSVDRSITAA